MTYLHSSLLMNFFAFLARNRLYKTLMTKSHCVKCPNTEFFLVRIFLCSDQKKLRIWTFFTQCLIVILFPFFIPSLKNLPSKFSDLKDLMENICFNFLILYPCFRSMLSILAIELNVSFLNSSYFSTM